MNQILKEAFPDDKEAQDMWAQLLGVDKIKDEMS